MPLVIWPTSLSALKTCAPARAIPRPVTASGLTMRGRSAMDEKSAARILANAANCLARAARPTNSPFSGEKLTANLAMGIANIGTSFPS